MCIKLLILLCSLFIRKKTTLYIFLFKVEMGIRTGYVDTNLFELENANSGFVFMNIRPFCHSHGHLALFTQRIHIHF